MYEGRTAANAGIVFGAYLYIDVEFRTHCLKGHENMGLVEQVGSGVTLLKKGDR